MRLSINNALRAEEVMVTSADFDMDLLYAVCLVADFGMLLHGGSDERQVNEDSIQCPAADENAVM